MKDKLNQFIDNTNGQFIEVSYRDAIYQCMDLAYLWVFILGFPKATIQNLYAYQVFTNPKSITKEYFDIIPNSPSFIPQDGDIGVFDKTSGNVAGHIGICLSGGNTQNFPFFEQNSPLGTNAHVTANKTYSKFLGVLRPKLKIQDPVALEITDQTKIPQIENMEVQKIKSEYYDRYKRLERQGVKIGELNKEIETLNAQITELKDKAKKYVVVETQKVVESGFFTRLGAWLDSKIKSGVNDKN